MRQYFRPALMALLVFSLLTGVIYPLTVTIDIHKSMLR